MKRFFVFTFIAVLFAGGAFLSCSNGSDGPVVGVTQVGGDGTTTNRTTEAENAKAVVAAIKALTKSGTVKVTGKMDKLSIATINYALKELARRDKNILVTLDLSEVTGLTELGSFDGCENLIGVILPNTLTRIGNYAFRGCTRLKTVTIPSSVTSIGMDIFSGCVESTAMQNENTRYSYYHRSALEEVRYTGTLAQWCELDIDWNWNSGLRYVVSYYYDVVNRQIVITGFGLKIYVQGLDITSMNCLAIPNGVKRISAGAFCGFTSLANIVIPDSVTSIGNDAFSYCSNLKSVVIPSSVTSIGKSAFENCSNLESATISNGVISIGDSAFLGCSNLKSMIIPNSVTNVDHRAFEGCKKLGTVSLGSGLTSIGSRVFYGVEPKNVNYTGTLAQWCNIAFADEYSNPFRFVRKLCIQSQEITNLDIPEGVKKIYPYAFYNLQFVTSVSIPDSVTSIGELAFCFCSIANITIPASVTKIGREAFEYSVLTSATFSDASGWYYTDNSNYTDGTPIDSATLADPATAAECLWKTYSGKYWYKL